MNPKIKKANIAAGVIGILAGISLFAIGILVCIDYYYDYFGYKTYGANFYTDIYRGVEKLVDGMRTISSQISVIFGTMMILGGILLILYSIRLIVISKNMKVETIVKNDKTITKSYETIAIELERFYDLYTKGILTEEEFTIQKQKIPGYKAEDLTSIKNNIDYK